MEPNIRDTPLRRFSTFWWGSALLLGVGLIVVILRPFLAGEPEELKGYHLDEQSRSEIAKLKTEQEELLNETKDLGDGKAVVPPSALFEKKAKELTVDSAE